LATHSARAAYSFSTASAAVFTTSVALAFSTLAAAAASLSAALCGRVVPAGGGAPRSHGRRNRGDECRRGHGLGPGVGHGDEGGLGGDEVRLARAQGGVLGILERLYQQRRPLRRRGQRGHGDARVHRRLDLGDLVVGDDGAEPPDLEVVRGLHEDLAARHLRRELHRGLGEHGRVLQHVHALQGRLQAEIF